MTRLAVFASGNGSNFEALANACASGKVAAKIAVLITDCENAYALERAKRLGIDGVFVDPKAFPTKKAMEQKMLEILKQYQAEWVCLAGYMRIVGETLREAYPDKIVNIHPALLPAFKGAHAIRDAYCYGVKVTGVTVHLIDDQIDCGKIVMQRAVDIDGLTLEETEAKIHETEHRLYADALNRLLEGKV